MIINLFILIIYFSLKLHRSLHNSLSYESSSCFSASEYFDATDGLSDVANSDTSSEVSSDNSSCTSDASDAGTDAHPSGKNLFQYLYRSNLLNYFFYILAVRSSFIAYYIQ